METKLKEKREKLGRTWEDYKSFRDSLPDDEGKWTDEQREKFEKFDTDIDAMESDIDSMEKRIERDKKDESREDRFSQEQDSDDLADVEDRQGDNSEDAEKREKAFEKFLSLTPLTPEERAFQVDSDIEGGYIAAPQKFINKLLKNVDRAIPTRGLATIHKVPKADSLGVVKLDTDAEDWDWTTELSTGNEEDTLRIGKREMRTSPIAKRVKLSKTLMRKNIMSASDLVIGRMKYKLGYTMESAYMTGTGSQQPLGMFVASDDGLTTGADVSTGNTTTAVKADGLIEAQEGLKEGYNGTWLFHPDGIKKLRKLKDGEGQYIWQPGLQKGTASSLLGSPYVKSRFVPNTWTSGLYVGMYADFKYYWIVDALDMQIQILNELYAESNQVGYIGRYEGDGQPVLEEAFRRITLA